MKRDRQRKTKLYDLTYMWNLKPQTYTNGADWWSLGQAPRSIMHSMVTLVNSTVYLKIAKKYFLKVFTIRKGL